MWTDCRPGYGVSTEPLVSVSSSSYLCDAAKPVAPIQSVASECDHDGPVVGAHRINDELAPGTLHVGSLPSGSRPAQVGQMARA